jgi:hypothetical protein
MRDIVKETVAARNCTIVIQSRVDADDFLASGFVAAVYTSVLHELESFNNIAVLEKFYQIRMVRSCVCVCTCTCVCVCVCVCVYVHDFMSHEK